MKLSLNHRFEALTEADRGRCLLDEIRIERGDISDYRALARFHYRGAHPGAVTAILRAALDRPTVLGRYLHRDSQRQCVGVIVRSRPHLACEMRDIATAGRYRGLSLRESAIMLNREVRTISRVVVDPRFRGCGLAVRLVRAALRDAREVEPGAIFIEALAAMGRVNPMFQRAGMTRLDPPPRPADSRLVDALESAGIAPASLCSMAMLHARMSRLDEAARRFIDDELRRWNRAAACRRTRQHAKDTSLQQIIASARRSIFTRPVYFLSALRAEIPGRSPLLADRT